MEQSVLSQTKFAFSANSSTMLDALETFIAVAAAGNFSEVARRQGVAVSSVTRKVDALEESLGFKLLNRSSRRLVMTDAGEQFLPRARNILGEFSSAKEAIFSNETQPSGVLSVTAPTAFGRTHVVSAIASFLRRHPAIEVELHLTDQIVDLAEQRMDVAIRVGVLPDSELHATVLAPLRLVTCASPAYLKRAGRPTSPEQLLQHDCITVATPPAASFVWRYPGINRNQPLPVRGTFRTDNKDGMLEAALQGVGVLHIATWVVSNYLRSGELVALFPEEMSAAVPSGMPAIHAVRLPGRSHATKARMFIEHLRREIGEDEAWWDRLEVLPKRAARGAKALA
jgi:DNA-binding transcriptional LysR family regulator